MVSYKEHTKAQVLAALWIGSHAQGMSFFATIPTHTHMTEEEAQKIIDERGENLYFDYLEGRVLKVDLRGDSEEFDERLYDRDCGEGAAQRAIDQLGGAT